jgi:hypothetical protein
LTPPTVRHAKRDPNQLGAVPYVAGLKISPYQTIFVAGNHEDFNFLRKHENQTIDPAGKIYYLASGGIIELATKHQPVLIAGYGGIHPLTLNQDKVRRGRGRQYHDLQAAERLMSLDRRVHILLAHDGPAGEELAKTYGQGAGSPIVRTLIEKLQPRYVFFGHYGRPPDPFMIFNTLVVPMNNPRAMAVPKRHSGMGILDTESWNFRFVPSMNA